MNDLADSTTITKIIPITSISAGVFFNFDKVVTMIVMIKLITTTDNAPNNKFTFNSPIVYNFLLFLNAFS